jgi:methionyl-tRNA formyltransferase
MRILFCGTPDFSVPPLQQLHAAGHDILAVFTQPDKARGRGQQQQKTPVKQAAEALGLTVHQPTGMKDAETQSLIADYQADLMVVVAYGVIIPQAVLDLPRLGCWNIHASLLPRWRGAAPIHRAILAGDKETGVCIMQMAAGLDTGPVYFCDKTGISPTDTAGQLHDRLSDMGGHAIVKAVSMAEKQTLPSATPQDDSQSSYAHKLHKSEAVIDWSQPAVAIERQIRAFTPWPGSQTKIQNDTLKIWHAEVIQQHDNDIPPGDIVYADAESLIINCGQDQLKLLEVQRAGKKRMAIGPFMRAKSDWYSDE